jgi:protein-tyrosine phosphatase
MIQTDRTQLPPRAGRLGDLHSHVLPCVDDGARDPEESLEMLRVAAADGTGVIAATPHASRCGLEQIIEEVNRLNALAAAEGLGITVVTGSEVRLNSDVPERYRAQQLATLNGTDYLLVELPLRGEWPSYVDRAIYDLQLAGALPILAHAERYPAVQQQPSILTSLIARGVLIQVNANSLQGDFGRSARDTAERLLESHLAHLIASDSHRPDSRPPRIRAAIERTEELAGPEYAGWMVEAAAAVIKGIPITLPDPGLPRGDSWLRRTLNRLPRT